MGIAHIAGCRRVVGFGSEPPNDCSVFLDFLVLKCLLTFKVFKCFQIGGSVEVRFSMTVSLWFLVLFCEFSLVFLGLQGF